MGRASGGGGRKGGGGGSSKGATSITQSGVAAVDRALKDAPASRLSDGTLEYEVKKYLPREVTRAMDELPGVRVIDPPSNSGLVFSWSKGDINWNVTRNPRTGVATIRAADYRVPARAEAQRNKGGR